jgi:hypothetical protein
VPVVPIVTIKLIDPDIDIVGDTMRGVDDVWVVFIEVVDKVTGNSTRL